MVTYISILFLKFLLSNCYNRMHLFIFDYPTLSALLTTACYKWYTRGTRHGSWNVYMIMLRRSRGITYGKLGVVAFEFFRSWYRYEFLVALVGAGGGRDWC